MAFRVRNGRVKARSGEVSDEKGLAALLEGHDAVISAAPFDGTDPGTLIAAVRASGLLPACRHELRRGLPARSRRGAGACGWCKDKWGLNWQITPRVLTKAMAAGGEEARRAFVAMMDMGKIDVAKIEAARRG